VNYSNARSWILGSTFFLALMGCTPSNALMPLRGEDPDSLALSQGQQAWLHETGATRAFARLREALVKGQVAAAWDQLGPNTRAIISARAANQARRPADLLREDRVEGLGLPGIEAPLAWLRTASRFDVRDAPFEPSRRKTTLQVQAPDAAVAVEVPAIYTIDGWVIELVRLMDGVTP